jgi:CHAT domain-containing protein
MGVRSSWGRKGSGRRAAALCGLALGVLITCQPRISTRQRLLAATGRYRPTPGWLSEESRYRPWDPHAAAGLGAHPEVARRQWLPLSTLERAVRAEAKGDPDGNPLDQAFLHLVRGKASLAILALELAAKRPEIAVAAWTDLSAAYLARFAAEGDPLDLLRSAQAAETGLRLAPTRPALLFNRAQALTRLGTSILADRAWMDFLAHAEPAGWRQEAAACRSQLRQPAADDAWQRSLLELRSPTAGEPRIAALVESFPARARVFAEEVLLPRWADAMSRGDDAAARHSLHLAAFIGQALERERGEALLADAITSIRAVMAEHGSLTRRRALLRGLQEFGYGVAQFNEQNLAASRPALSAAARDLATARLSLRYWARFYLAVSERYANADRGLALLLALEQEIPRDRFLALAGRIEWIAGTSDKIQGRVQSSVRRYERAARWLRRAGGDEGAAFVAVLLAESYSLLGQHSLGWQNRFSAFHTVPACEGMRHNIAMWIEAKGALVRQGGLALAGPLVEEAVAVAERWQRPLGRATAYVDRAAYRLEVGARAAAMGDLCAAQHAVAEMEESDLKRQTAYLVLITEGLCHQKTEPAKAASLLRRGLEGQKATGDRFDAIDYTTAMAAAELAAGRPRAAAASLAEAISLFEDIRSTVEDPAARMQAFRRAQPAFDSLIRLRAGASGDGRDGAFDQAERSRARVLLELRAPNGVPAVHRESFATLSDLERILPRHVALVSYAALADEVLAWVVQGGRARLVILKSDRDRLVSGIERFRLELSHPGPEAALREAGAPLYDLLVRPLELAPVTDRSLIVIPDRWLARLPFAALFDRREGRYLIEQRTVSMVPSATLLVKGSRSGGGATDPELSAVAFGVPRAGSFSGKLLPALPGAAREAREVAAVYGTRTALLDAEATRENFLRQSVSHDVVHFAGHAVVDLEAPHRSVLLFAGQSPDALEPLSLAEMLAAGRPAGVKLMVLSACRTEDSLADDREGLLGLAGAFFAAGVPEVVASPWDVDDQAAAPLMRAFHQQYRQRRSAAAAYRDAVLDLLASGPPEARSAASWGAFTVIAGLSASDMEVRDGPRVDDLRPVRAHLQVTGRPPAAPNGGRGAVRGRPRP